MSGPSGPFGFECTGTSFPEEHLRKLIPERIASRVHRKFNHNPFQTHFCKFPKIKQNGVIKAFLPVKPRKLGGC